jgi:hypothetical protein
MQCLRFDGDITGLGTESGTRLVVGVWSASPFGPIVDAMIEEPDGRRTLLAPSREVADFIAATYTFDAVRIEEITLRRDETSSRITSPSLDLEIHLGGRTAIGRVLRLVPGPLRRARWWCRAIGPAARLLRPGVRTVGTAGGGRREYYCAADEHAVISARGSLDGADLGGLAPVLPAVRFGFASTPPTPSRVRVTTLIDIPE